MLRVPLLQHLFSLTRRAEKILVGSAICNYRTTSRLLDEEVAKENLIYQIFDQTERKKIIDTINSSTDEQLLKNNKLSSKRIRQLLIDNRPFNCLTEVQTLSGANIVQMVDIFEQVLHVHQHGVTESKSRTRSRARLFHCHPPLDPEKSASVKAITSLYLDAKTSLSMTMTSELEFVRAEEHKMTTNINLRKYDHTRYIQAVKTLIDQLPSSDVYLIVRPQIRISKVTPYAAALYGGKQLLDATFYALKSSGSSRGSVHNIKLSSVDSAFGLNVGTERVHTEQVVDTIIESGKWGEHTIKELDIYRRNVATFSQIPYFTHLTFLHCLYFITKILYPSRELHDKCLAGDHPNVDEIKEEESKIE